MNAKHVRPPAPQHKAAPNPATSAVPAAAHSTHFAFVQLQLTYFMGQLTMADAKAGGIVVFTTAISGISAEQMHLGSNGALSGLDLLALVALAGSAITGTFAFKAVWPRGVGHIPGGELNPFSWVNLSTIHATKPGTHCVTTLATSEGDLIKAVAHTTEELAAIIARKYASVRSAFAALVVTTIAHVAYWVLR